MCPKQIDHEAHTDITWIILFRYGYHHSRPSHTITHTLSHRHARTHHRFHFYSSTLAANTYKPLRSTVLPTVCATTCLSEQWRTLQPSVREGPGKNELPQLRGQENTWPLRAGKSCTLGELQLGAGQKFGSIDIIYI